MKSCLLPLFLIALGVSLSCGGFPDKMPSDCSVFSAQETSPYILPYEVGRSFEVWKTTSHGGTQYYSVDFRMPIGTPVIASRSGEVVNLEMSFQEGDRVFGHENLIWIRHVDGTIARYYHLAPNSTRVANGDEVDQGQVIALSGDTGNSTGPHLHFDVTQCLTGLTPGDINTLPCGQTLPLSFKNTLKHTCGLKAGKDYPAFAY